MNFIERLTTKQILYFAALMSVCLSLAQYIIGGDLNPDGIVYLRAAQAFIEHGFSASMQVYNWPLYPMLIAFIHKATLLSYQDSAIVINTVLQAGITLGFVLLVKELGGNVTTQFFATLIILLQPHLNGYHDDYIRDFGYWCFYLFALWTFIRFIKLPSWNRALLWWLLAMIASLFRIEGVAIMLCLPLAALTDPTRSIGQRCYNLLKLYSLSFLILFALIGIHVFLAEGHPLRIGRLQEIQIYLFNIYHYPVSSLSMAIKNMQEHVLTPLSARGADKLLITGIMGYYLIKLVATANIILLGLMVYAFYKRLLKIIQPVRWTLVLIVAINVFITAYILLLDLFLSGRYLLALTMTLLLPAPFAVAYLYGLWRDRRMIRHSISYVFPVVLLVFFVFTVKLIYGMPSSHHYVLDAGRWLKIAPHTEWKVISNNQQLLYHARQNTTDWQHDYLFSWRSLMKQNTQQAHYLALDINHRQHKPFKQLRQAMGMQPIKIFANKRGDKIYVFNIKPAG